MRKCNKSGVWENVNNPCKPIMCPTYTDATSASVTIDGITRSRINDVPGDTYYVQESNYGNSIVNNVGVKMDIL